MSNADGRSPERQSAEGKRLSEVLKRRWKCFGSALFVIGIVFCLRWFTLSATDDRYLWPKSAADWGAWGTWAGAIGAVSAVFYAARSVQQALNAQAAQEKDREEARVQREEAHQELLEDVHRTARVHANQLKWTIYRSRPSDTQYATVQNRLATAQQKYEEQREANGGWHPNEDPRPNYDISRIYVLISNFSAKTEFCELSLHLPVPHEHARVAAIERRSPLPPRMDTEDYLPGVPPQWIKEKYEPAYPEQDGLLEIGSLEPQTQILVELEFSNIQDELDWSEYGFGHNGTLILRFRDPDDRYWLRSSRPGTYSLFRSWGPNDHPPAAMLNDTPAGQL